MVVVQLAYLHIDPVKESIGLELLMTYFFVHSFAVAKNLLLSFLRSCSVNNYTLILTQVCEWRTAAMSGSNGSSGLGLFNFSLITERTTTAREHEQC
jgi:hypothetical protein